MPLCCSILIVSFYIDIMLGPYITHICRRISHICICMPLQWHLCHSSEWHICHSLEWHRCHWRDTHTHTHIYIYIYIYIYHSSGGPMFTKSVGVGVGALWCQKVQFSVFRDSSHNGNDPRPGANVDTIQSWLKPKDNKPLQGWHFNSLDLGICYNILKNIIFKTILQHWFR